MVGVDCGEAVEVDDDQSDVIQRAIATFKDKELAKRTAFRRAAALQIMADSADVAFEVQYLQQWMAFEILVQRWAEVNADAPQKTHFRNSVVRKIRQAVREGMRPLEKDGVLSVTEACAVTKDVRSNIYPPMPEKTRAFLTAHRMKDVDSNWMHTCIDLRNDIAHGRSLGEITNKRSITSIWTELPSRRRDVRRLVNRYVMQLMGYEAYEAFEPRGADVFGRKARRNG